MKYVYAYKTSDGTRHEESMDAESREAVFAALRERGIKAIKVVAADGSKANGEIRGVRKRALVLAVVLTMAVVGGGMWLLLSEDGGELPVLASAGGGRLRPAEPLPRQALAGSRERLQRAFDGAFSNRVDRLLVRFAEPGRDFVAPVSDWPSREEVDRCLRQPILVADNEFTEQVDVKRIVVGLRMELASYLRAGGYVSGYMRELVKRQNTEIGYRRSAEERLNGLLARPETLDTRQEKLREAYDCWLKANGWLQSMGIRPLALPEALREHQLSLTIED